MVHCEIVEGKQDPPIKNVNPYKLWQHAQQQRNKYNPSYQLKKKLLEKKNV